MTLVQSASACDNRARIVGYQDSSWIVSEFGSREAGKKGGKARAEKLTVAERRQIARKAAEIYVPSPTSQPTNARRRCTSRTIVGLPLKTVRSIVRALYSRRGEFKSGELLDFANMIHDYGFEPKIIPD
ncbi:MAG TPA: hypothetical protein VGK58_17275 [Lacipirellulaceae bacterium]